MRLNIYFTPTLLGTALLLTSAAHAMPEPHMNALVDETIVPLMAEHRIPGMAVAIHVNGERYLFDYGLADREAGVAVDAQTLFELGSLSKLYTGLLAAYAEASGALALADPVSRHLTTLEGSAFDDVTLLELATYTAGGLPLQVPETVEEPAVLDYFRQWTPTFAPGTHRLYSNPSIGLLGVVVARRLGDTFEAAMNDHVFTPLALEHSFYDVPESERAHYAWGYSADDTPRRVSPGVLDAQAYGLKATASDVLRFVEAHLDSSALAPALQQALATTREGYVSLGAMTQGLGWERYAYPTTLDALKAGNALDVVLEANPVKREETVLSAESPAFFNKTGATNGFGNYVALVPEAGIAVVLLANRNYPTQARIEAAYTLIERLNEAP
ncbi:class C beta-lactamase [Halomonas sp. PAMB 3232]|uniref:class C beta-lactamase n=1 Tax=Halomonas sp. PAMB 3232 TaxID=3075221 RepID=UPI00289A02F7|nr:class C beta-lactamase [Halomonas sp. PAMB 3232]WNL38746.1 class C beta-lactamase [Halomonas sp. PAMB 3232]